MKHLYSLSLILLISAISACSGGGGGSTATLTPPASKDNLPDFNVAIDPNACLSMFMNPFNEEDFWEDELSAAIRQGDASCTKKIIELSKLDVNKPITGFFVQTPTRPLWRALNDTSFFFTKGEKFSVIKVLVEAGADLRITNSNGENPLHFALKNTDQEKYSSVSQYLIQTGKVLLDQMDQQGNSAIHYIIDDKNLASLNLLNKHGANINLQSKGGVYPLFQSMKNLWLDGALNLVQMGAKLDILDTGLNTPLHVAIMKDLNPLAIDLARRFNLEKLNKLNETKQTALYLSLLKKNYDVTQSLLAFNADVNISSLEAAPIHLALEWQNVEVSKVIIARASLTQINERRKSGEGAIHIATLNNDIDSLSALLSRGANSNLKNIKNETALHLATRKESKLAMNLLIANNSDVNSQDNNGNTALHLVAKIEYAQILLSANADINVSNQKSQTPIALSAINANEDLLLFYAAKGADLDWIDGDSKNLLHIATSQSLENAVEFLLKNIDVNSQTSDGKNSLFFAQQINVFKKLTSAGINPEKEDSKGNTVFTYKVSQYVQNNLKKDLLAQIRLLIEMGIDVNHPVGKDKETVLFLATREYALTVFGEEPIKRFPELYKILLNSEINLNLENTSGKTVLFFADTVEEINDLKKGSLRGPVDVKIKDKKGRNAQAYLTGELSYTKIEIKITDEELSQNEVLLIEAESLGDNVKIAKLKKKIEQLSAHKNKLETKLFDLNSLSKAIEA